MNLYALIDKKENKNEGSICEKNESFLYFNVQF